MTKHPKHFAFIDVETTGLDPKTCSAIEVGCVITDFDMKPLGEPFHRVLRTMKHDWRDVEAMAMHKSSGLYDLSTEDWEDGHRVWGEGVVSAYEGRAMMMRYIHETCDGVIHVGFNPEFDAEFMSLRQEYALKNIDVLGLRRTVRSCIGEHALPPIYKPGHRVLTDIRHCMDEFRYYIGLFKDGFSSA